MAATYRQLATRLAATRAITVGRGDAAWPWPEPRLTYENALLPRALIVAGLDLRLAPMLARGLAMLDWLIDVQTEPDGHLSPVGNGWWAADGSRSRFDQQPIEPASLLLAAEAALRATGDPRYRDAMEGAYAWFLGFNDLGLAVADPARGACHDGLDADGRQPQPGSGVDAGVARRLERIRRAESGETPAVAASRNGERPTRCRPAHDRRPPSAPRHRSRATSRRHGRTDDAAAASPFRRSARTRSCPSPTCPTPPTPSSTPGAARLADETVLLVRVEDLRGISHLHVARSADGVTGWRLDPDLLLRSDVTDTRRRSGAARTRD